MIDIESQNKAIKISWIPRLMELEGTWRCYVLDKIPINIQYMARCNIKFADLPFKFPKHTIWNEIWVQWCLENYKDEIIYPDEILNQNLWFNSHIRIQNKVVCYKTWENKGIRWVNDLLFEENDMTLRFLTLEEFKDHYDLNPNALTYLGLKDAIPKDWKRRLWNHNGAIEDNIEDLKLADKLIENKEKTRTMYKTILKRKSEKPTNALNKWMADIQNSTTQQEILNVHYKQRFTTRDNKLRSFNYNFLQRNIPYERRLHLMKIKETPNCKDCNMPETILHLYWTCPKSKRLWERLKMLIEGNLKTHMYLCPKKCMLGIGNWIERRKREPIWLLTILTKHYIHLCKCNETERNIKGLERYIKSKLRIEKLLAMKNGEQNLFTSRWEQMTDWIEHN